MSEMYADNYVKPRLTPILLDILVLASGFWAFVANFAIFESWLSGLGFCVFAVAFLFFGFELFYRLWPVRTRRLKDGTKITRFYLGWSKDMEKAEFIDGSCSIYSTSNGATYIDPRELVKSSQFEIERALTDLVKQARDK